MIAYRDFKPETPGFFAGSWPFRQKFDAALAEANDWIDREAIDVLGVETLGQVDAALEIRWIRVWYRDATTKPRPLPEL